LAGGEPILVVGTVGFMNIAKIPIVNIGFDLLD
jgi:hypothetical protein